MGPRVIEGDEWVDVTAECDLHEGADGETNQIRRTDMAFAVGYVNKGYRFRKLSLWELYDQTESKSKQMVFIVEKLGSRSG